MRVSSLYKNSELRKRLFVLLGMLGIFKLGMYVYVPGINRSVLEGMTADSGIMNMMNTFTGGALSSFSIFAVGIMPYITASIIVQLLQMDVSKTLMEWREQGEHGQKKLKKLTYGLAVTFALLQAFGLSYLFNKIYDGLMLNPSVLSYIVTVLFLTLGTIILIILGEIIDRKGIGKGISMIIVSGILFTLPENLFMYYELHFANGVDNMLIEVVKALLLVLFLYAVLIVVIVINGGERRIPIQYSTGNGNTGRISNRSFMPLKLNATGVIPIIFASTLLMMPSTIVQLTGSTGGVSRFIQTSFNTTSYLGIAFYALMILAFTYFYTFAQMNPSTLADNLRKSNSFIPGIRSGKETEEYFRQILMKLAFVGSLFLAVISALPMLMGKEGILPEQLALSGASIIIIVSVVVDILSQLETEVGKSNYERFISNKPVEKMKK